MGKFSASKKLTTFLMDTVNVSQIYHVERKLIRFEYRRRRRPCSKGRGGIRVSSQTKASSPSSTFYVKNDVFFARTQHFA